MKHITLFKELLRHLKVNRTGLKGNWRKLKPLVLKAPGNIKHSPIPSQINMTSHTKILNTLLPIT